MGECWPTAGLGTIGMKGAAKQQMTGTCPAVGYQSGWFHKWNECCTSENTTVRKRTCLRTALADNICKRVDVDRSRLGTKRVKPCAWERVQNPNVPVQVSILKPYGEWLMTIAWWEREAHSNMAEKQLQLIWYIYRRAVHPTVRTDTNQWILISSPRISTTAYA